MDTTSFLSNILHGAGKAISNATANVAAVRCGNECFVCGDQNFAKKDVTDQINTFVKDTLKQHGSIDPTKDACLHLYVTGCKDTRKTKQVPWDDHQLLSTIDDSITFNELLSNIDFISRMCLKYKAVHLRIDLVTKDQDQPTHFDYEM